MNLLYCDCFSGISGDMFLAAMIDAGLPLDLLDTAYKSLNLPEYNGISFKKVMKGVISAGKIDFQLVEPDHHHHHHHDHHKADHHHHHHRSYADIRKMLRTSNLSDPVKEKTLAIFAKIAEAEADVHNKSIDEVHFHEVGAVDSILDIVGAAVALDYFSIDKVYSSPLPLGTGEVMTQHGMLPIPAPATAWLIREMKAQIAPSDVRRELVTPTGAGILAAFASFSQPAMTVDRLGVGAGQAELEKPNIMRVMIGQSSDAEKGCVVIEANIDDMTAEQLGAVLNAALDHGALDAWFTAIQMKKNRPAVKLSLIVPANDEENFSDFLLEHTTTLGVRSIAMNRKLAKRSVVEVKTRFGQVKIKIKETDNGGKHAHPEYDDCERIARAEGLPFLAVYEEAMQAYLNAKSDE